jgi:hypothetical protein
METKIQDLIIGLKKLSKEYKFKTDISVRLSSEVFKLDAFGLLIIELQEDPTRITLIKAYELKTKIMDLLEKVSYPHSLDIKIESTEDVLEKYGIYIGKGIKYLEDRFLSDVEMDFKEDETDFTEVKFTNTKRVDTKPQKYELIVNKGFAKLETRHDKETHNFHSNLKVVDFVNTLVDEKISTYDPTDVLTIAASIRNFKEKQRELQSKENIVSSQFSLHYENHDAIGLFNIIETKDDSKVELGLTLNRLKNHTDLPFHLVGRIIDKGIHSPYVRMKDCIVEERLNNKSLYDLKKDVEPIIESFLADTDLTISNVTSAYLNLDCLMRTRCHVDYNKLYLFSDDKLIAQINFNPRGIGIPVVIERAQYKIQENIERFLYETHGDGYHILAERLKDDESTESALEFFNNLNVDFTKSITKPLSTANDLPPVPEEY